MKIVGIVLIALGAMNLIICFIGISTNPEYAAKLVQQLFFDIGFIGLGIYLINRANTKKKEQEDKEKWAKSVEVNEKGDEQ
jgi:nicotinamide riboside transporter PnuC